MTENNSRSFEFEEEPLPHEAIGSRELLSSAVQAYKVSFESLERLTGIGRNDLEAYSSGDSDLDHLDAAQRSAAFDLIAFLGLGINTPQIPPEERLRAVMQGLSESFGLTPEVFALQSGVEPSDAERFLAGRKVAAEKRFKLAVGVLFLYFLIYRRADM
ncbi:HTH domain-containing protein [Saccharibacillus alkalitolerans]|uniref:Transcriptional regulator n=1 Tax=Saccharibacillus alkalitolerans TaxID=2705290 RepID=A0ABX0FAU9_9BACL|nr:HTH domain-containing protein [Saccharibacillus alkalitolerans]NGZ77413.1 hypothetical protein [Saccharibacillus alkalitolerans]